MLWYPHKDMEDSPMIMGQMNYSRNDYMISIEKSSFGKTGKVLQHFEPEFNQFIDKNPTVINRLDNKAPEEKNMEQIAMELK
jgi:phage antirepressor YoqD-like protein